MAAGFKLIEDFYDLMAQAIAGGVVIPPAAYESKMTGTWGDPSSDNWNTVASGFEGVNHLRRQPTSRPLGMLGEYVWFELTGGKGAGLGQREFGGEYTHHQFSPMWVLWNLWPALAEREPTSFTPEREASLHSLLWAWLGWHGAAGTDIFPRVLTVAEASQPGPRVVRSSGARAPLRFTCLNGERGFVYYNGRLIYLVEKGQNDIWEHFCRGRRLALYGRVEDALSGFKGRNLLRPLVSPEEQARFRAAAAGDVAALDWCASLARGFKAPRCRPWIRVYASGARAMGILRAASQSTAPVYATLIHPDGTVECLVIDRGDRAEADPGTAVLDEAAGTVTARRNNGSGEPVTLRLPPESDCIWKLDTLEDGSIATWRADRGAATPPPPPAAEPVPVPGPTPGEPGSRADAFDWLANAGAGLCAVGPGYFAQISPVAGFPHLFVLRKSGGALPVAGTEILWRDEERDRIALVAECGYDEAADTVGNLRTFWLDDGTPGTLWLPRWIDRASPASFRIFGNLVENAITAAGAPYRPDGSRLAPGEWQQARVDADAVLTHVGVTRQLGEDVAVLRRVDKMGDRSKPATRNVEEYDIGFGRGAYGYIAWSTFPRGVFERRLAADRVQPQTGPCRFYGFDPLDPEHRERWMSTPGFAGELPPTGPPTRRPSVTSAPQVGGGGRPGGSCLVLLAAQLAALAGAAAALAAVLR
jgi:hypothetical protein